MKVCLLNAGFDTRFASAEHLLDCYQNVPNLAEALAEQGHQVVALQAFHHDDKLRRGRVEIELIATKKCANSQWAEIERIADITNVLEKYQPDVVHFFGLTITSLRRSVGKWCAQHGVILTASFHGGRASRNPLRRWRQRQVLSQTSAFFFSNIVAAKQWQNAGVLPKLARIILAPEVSSPFSGVPKQSARRTLGVEGNPVFVSSGHLCRDKDPITTLKGLQRVARTWPKMRLLMAFQSDEILNEIRKFLDKDESFKKRVTLLGRLDHADMETLFSAADFFVHSSRREIGSHSLVEALSCGAIPVVADIPSLRALTENVEPAILFEVGDAEGLARQVLELQLNNLQFLSQQVNLAFDAHLSYRALAAEYSAVFESLVCTRTQEPSP